MNLDKFQRSFDRAEKNFQQLQQEYVSLIRSAVREAGNYSKLARTVNIPESSIRMALGNELSIKRLRSLACKIWKRK